MSIVVCCLGAGGAVCIVLAIVWCVGMVVGCVVVVVGVFAIVVYYFLNFENFILYLCWCTVQPYSVLTK